MGNILGSSGGPLEIGQWVASSHATRAFASTALSYKAAWSGPVAANSKGHIPNPQGQQKNKTNVAS